jgi:hypothetical protein
MSKKQVIGSFGEPTSVYRNNLIYVLEDSSILRISLRDKVVTSAEFKYQNPQKIEDSDSRKLTLVQMESENNFDGSPKWFFAGNPKDGLIYKISSLGKIETLTWVPPFTYGTNRPKQLQALYKDFRVKQTSNL